MSKFTRTAAGILGAVGIVASSMILAPAAHAASGGGCWEYSEGYERSTYVNWSSCISAPKAGIGRPDAYVTLRAGHPACKIMIQVLRTGGSKVMSQKIYDCPSGAIRNKRFTAPDFKGDNATPGRAYATYTTIFWTSSKTATMANKSPWLKLP
ncbi:hypothetical protein PV721_01165 [Streptomyces sp. MB09-01]|uniref:hypothetical protein n=1 Tax=Streptomyces sp. MB09-01 TaxID=3028666 RepID=UPI0029A89848|nr:hypothetical protein [Streptomyces sp. MB09-01]MDX3533003.1 hypothetical protein [Streptomyces sp. MB09-01]